MVKQHTRTGPSHDGADALTHVFTVAVDRALSACRFTGSESASVKPLKGVVKKSGTLPAELSIVLFVPTIHPYHQLHNEFLFCQTVMHWIA